MCDSKKACQPGHWPGLFFVTLAPMLYLWVKAFHIFFVASWFAGLFYLPRIYVNLAVVPAGSDAERMRLLVMARKLLRFMSGLGIIAIALGLWLWLGFGIGAGSGWMHAKLLVVLLLIAYNIVCARLLRQFEAGTATRSHVWFRWFNEIPTVLLLAAVLLVVIKPF
jgi:protoporphyrinogen IX oxidase